MDILTQKYCCYASKAFRTIPIILIYLLHSPLLFQQGYIQHISYSPHLRFTLLISSYPPTTAQILILSHSSNFSLIISSTDSSRPSSPSKSTEMASRGNGRRPSADGLTRELDTLSASSSSKPVLCSAASIYGSHSKITIIPNISLMYSLPAHPLVLQHRPKSIKGKSRIEKLKKRKARTA